jgi:hypothetical protein
MQPAVAGMKCRIAGATAAVVAIIGAVKDERRITAAGIGGNS